MSKATKPKVITPKASAAEKEMAALAQEQWDYYKQHYMPLTQDYIDTTLAASDSKNTGALERSMLTGQVGHAVDRSADTVRANLFATGATPAGGRMAMAEGDLGRARALGLAQALSAHDNEAERQRLAGLATVAQTGRGVATNAVGGLGSAARLQNAANIAAQNATLNDRRQTAGLIASTAGALMGGYGAYMNNQRQQNQWQAYNDRLLQGGAWGYDERGVYGNSNGVGFTPYALTPPTRPTP
jgi:hypothetical protein